MNESIVIHTISSAGSALSKTDIKSLGIDRLSLVLGAEKIYVDKILSAIERHLDDEGFMKAASGYEWYSAEWFRDSSMVSISLTQFASFLRKNGFNDTNQIWRVRDASNRLLSFMLATVGSFQSNIEGGLLADLNDEKAHLLHNHIPARFGKDKTYFKLNTANMQYSDEVDGQNSWLRQHDSIPLLLIAVEYFVNEFGLDALHGRDTLKRLLPVLTAYLSKVYVIPCSNAWELENTRFHSYSLASIYRGLAAAENLLKPLGVNDEKGVYAGACRNNMEKIKNILDSVFVKDKTLYRSVDGPLDRPNLILEGDAAEIFIFTLFDTPFDEEVKHNTLNLMEKELFGQNVLPIRFKNDVYFDGGRWLLLGLEFAYYYMSVGEHVKASRIMKYVQKKYLDLDDQLPEQEIVDPASPGRDPDKMLEKNGGNTIKDLAWSEAEYLRAATRYLLRT